MRKTCHRTAGAQPKQKRTMDNNRILQRARAYLAKIPPAVSLHRGSNATFYAAQVLVRGFALGQDEAFLVLSEWNARCLPPWSDLELLYKLKDARQNGRMEIGKHLKVETRLPAKHPSVLQPTNPLHEAFQQLCKLPPVIGWPELNEMDELGMETLARLRGVKSVDVLYAQRLLGAPLKRGIVYDHDCAVFQQGEFGQARRLDGLPFDSPGRELKVKNLPGSRGGFIGSLQPLSKAQLVILTEGTFGIIDAIAAWHLAGFPDGVLMVAATSAHSGFAKDIHWLERFRNTSVRILPDNDESGLKAANRWHSELQGVARNVQIRRLPDGSKDLGELLAAHPLNISLFQSLICP
jgi:hypothetical protein